MEEPHYTVRNWTNFQHYTKRNPPWIKLHTALLTSKDWVVLDDASRVLAIAIMLLASKNEGKVPADKGYLHRVAYLNNVPDFTPLIKCGFLVPCEQVASGLLADARPEAETEAEIETEKDSRPSAKDKAEAEGGQKAFAMTNPPGPSLDDRTFDDFWDIYPLKVKKKRARSAWKKIKRPVETLGKIKAALEWQVRLEQWTRENGRYVPQPATYLNAGQWDDEKPKDGLSWLEDEK